jgi:hypothetical protein
MSIKSDVRDPDWIRSDYDREINKLLKQLAHKQFEIDNLMLEYCPDRMTYEQLENWSRHQVAVK